MPESLLHRVAKRVLPTALYPRTLIGNAILARTGRVVFSGPFRDLRYVESSVGSVYFPKLLGTYERELHTAMEELIARRPARILDLGAAEGYYAVGLATRLTASSIVAYEEDEVGRGLLRQLAAMNSVAERIIVRGRCTPDTLAADLVEPGSVAIVCDIEGGEAAVLDPVAVAGLRKAWILVELHEFVVPGIGAELSRRFVASHHVERIEQRPRTVEDYPFPISVTRWLPEPYASELVQEHRPEPMSWLVLRPHG